MVGICSGKNCKRKNEAVLGLNCFFSFVQIQKSVPQSTELSSLLHQSLNRFFFSPHKPYLQNLTACHLLVPTETALLLFVVPFFISRCYCLVIVVLVSCLQSEDPPDFTRPLSSPDFPDSPLPAVCSVCRSAGCLLICSSCHLGFHPGCHVPPAGQNSG